MRISRPSATVVTEDTEDTEALAAILALWNSDFTLTDMPDDLDLDLVDALGWLDDVTIRR